MTFSKKRAEAARANGAKSRGPKTPEGKLRSQTHAIRHGVLAENVVLEGEDRETFRLLMAELEERFHPVGNVEFGMLEEMGNAYWRMRRAWIIEAEILNSGMRSRDGEFDAWLTATFTDPDTMPKLALLQRYETRLHRMYSRALHNLLVLQEQKKKSEIAEQPEDAEILQEQEIAEHREQLVTRPVEPLAAKSDPLQPLRIARPAASAPKPVSGLPISPDARDEPPSE